MKILNLLLTSGILSVSSGATAAMMLELKPTSPAATHWFDAISIQLPTLQLNPTEQQRMNLIGQDLLFGETLSYYPLDTAVGQVHLHTFCAADGLTFASNACHQATMSGVSQLQLQHSLASVLADSLSYRSSITVAFSSFSRWDDNNLSYELFSDFRISAYLPELISGPLQAPAARPTLSGFINVSATSSFEPVQISHTLTVKNAQNDIVSQSTDDTKYVYDTELTIRQVSSPSPVGILLLGIAWLLWHRRSQA